jgi:type I restriction enzyme, S subunit
MPPDARNHAAMKIPAYPRTKPSGVAWLGDVPEHWEVKRLKTSATCWVSNVDKVPAEDELPVRLCNYTDVYYHDHITPDMGLMETTATADEIRRFGLRVGDVVITKDSEEWSDIAVPSMVKKTAPDLVCGYHLAIIRSRPKALIGDYLLRAFQSCAVNQQFQVAASGVTRYGLPKASIGDAWIPLPDPAEQRAIAAFLDRETGRVDRLVAKKRELIERLKEKRTALISRTVMRGLPAEAAAKAGLPANPPLKPSGLDWLGDIPKHWAVMRLRRVVRIIEQGWSPECNNSIAAADEWGVVKAGCCNGGRFNPDENKTLPPDLAPLKSLEIKAGDLLMSRASGSEDLIGSVALVPSGTRGQLLLSDKTYRLQCDETIAEPGFLARVLQSPIGRSQIQAVISGAFGLAKNIAQSDVKDFALAVPPLPEQAAIAAYLDKETAKLDALVGKVEEAVERLQEYRTALITAAVTGKIDIRTQMGENEP